MESSRVFMARMSRSSPLPKVRMGSSRSRRGGPWKLLGPEPPRSCPGGARNGGDRGRGRLVTRPMLPCQWENLTTALTTSPGVDGVAAMARCQLLCNAFSKTCTSDATRAECVDAPKAQCDIHSTDSAVVRAEPVSHATDTWAGWSAEPGPRGSLTTNSRPRFRSRR